MNNPYLEKYNALKDSAKMCVAREHMVGQYGFAIPTEEAILRLKDFSPLIEMGAGTGYWAWLLRQVGANIIAYDNQAYLSTGYSFTKQHTEIAYGTPESILNHPGLTLFMSWPPLNDPMAENCLDNYKGTKLIVITEDCCATPEFHARLRKEWTLIDTIDIPRWPHVRDWLGIYGRSEL